MIIPSIKLTGKQLQFVALWSCTCCAISGGLHLGWTAPYLPKLLASNSPIPITDGEGSWIAVSFLIGALCGSGLSALTLDKFGRKNMILATTLPYLISPLITAFATSMWELCVARFLAGIPDGMAYCAMPLYLTEIADPKIRGLFISFLEFMQLLGSLVSTILGTYIDMDTFAFASMSVPIFVFVTFIWLPETPHYYCVKGDIENARTSLQKFSGKMDVTDTLNSILATVENCQSSKNKFVTFFTNPISRKGISILLVLRGVQQFSGITAFMFYLPVILENAKDFVSPTTSIVIYYSLQMLFAFATLVVIDRIGRKPLLLFSISVVSAALLIVGIYFSLMNLSSINVSSYTWIPLVGLFLYIMGYSSGLHSIPLLLSGEIFPIEVKVLGITVFDMYFCVTSSIASKYFQFTKDTFGIHVPFLTFAIICISSLPVIICLVSETKKKTLEEIQTENKLKNKKQVNNT